MPAPEAVVAIRRLLAAYAGMLDTIDALPAFPMVASRWRRRSRLGRPGALVQLPRFSWMLRSLTLWHIDRVLRGAEQALRRRSALGTGRPGEDEALNAITEFRASLPARSKTLRLGALAVAVLVLAHILAALLVRLDQHHIGGGIPLSGMINQVLDSTLSTLQLTAGSLDQVIDALLRVSLSVLAAAALLLGLSLYVILWPVASAFRVKRMLLNLYPDPLGKLACTPASWTVTRSEGAYDLEREVLARLGARVPGEPPLDLLVSVPAPVCWMVFCTYSFILTSGPLGFSTLVLAVELLLFIPPPAIRLAWLAAAWRARTGRGRSTWLFGGEVSVPWRAVPVRCRSPLLIGWLSLTFLYTWPVLWWLWWATARDLRDLGRAYDVRRLRRIRPWAQGLGVGAGSYFLSFVLVGPVLALVVLFRAPRLVREAQLAAGLDQPVARRVAWLAFIWPVQCVLLQRELNRLWHREAARAALEPGAAAASLLAPFGWPGRQDQAGPLLGSSQ